MMNPQDFIKHSILGDIAVGFEPDIEVSDRFALWNQLCRTYRESGYTFLDLLIAMDLTSLEETVRYIAKIRSYIKSTPNCILVSTPEDII